MSDCTRTILSRPQTGLPFRAAWSFWQSIPNAQVPAGQVTYHFRGDCTAVPLVLLHGFCEDHSVWNTWLTQLPSLPVIWIDLPGFGGSALPHASDMSHYAEAVRSVLDDVGVQRCVLYGHSLGGYAALEFAARHPERLAGA